MKMKWRAIGLLLLVIAAIFPASLFGQTFVWTQTSATNNVWTGIAASTDGTKLAACYGYDGGGVYTSTNTGLTWLKVAAPAVINSWLTGGGLISIASSADGKKLVAGGNTPLGAYNSTNSGYIYTSANAGLNWTQTSAPWENWTSVALSSDGTKLVAAGHFGIWKSTDGGLTGTFYSQQFHPGVGYWKTVALSTNGSLLVATDIVQIYTSINAGIYPWNLTSAPINQWSAIASSADGTKLVACNDYNIGRIYTSTNSGLTWTQTSAPSNSFWSAVTSSADGTKLAACSYSGNIYYSTNSGSTWTSNSFPTYVKAMAVSSDGTKLFAVFYGGGISVGQLVVPAQNFSATVSGSGVNLQFTGTPNCAYILQATTNLASSAIWQPVVTNSTDASGNWSFTDTNANQYSQRFFRASQ